HTEIASVRQWLVNVWVWCIARHGLAFDDAQRTQLRHLLTDASPVHDIDDLTHVLIGFRDFLHEGGAASGAHINALILHLARNRPAARRLFRLGAAQHAPGTVAATGEGFRAALGRANEHIGIAPHIAWHQHRLPEVTVDLGELRMAWGQRACGTLPMHTQPPWLAVNHVGLEFADIMAHVVDDFDAYVPGRSLQDFFKGIA